MTDVAELDVAFAPPSPEEASKAKTAQSVDIEDYEIVLPVSPEAPPKPETHSTLGYPTSRWVYRNSAGEELFEILRFDKPDGDKIFLPLTLWRGPNGLHWRFKSVPTPRPLYGLHELAKRPNACIILCEGEKAADAAAKIFLECVPMTSPNGARAADKAQWDVLRNRTVLIWPDDDEEGSEYVANVAAKLTALNCRVSVIDAGTLARTAPEGGTRTPSKKGWDAAEAILEWPDMTALRHAALDCAKPFEAAGGQPNYLSFGRFTMNAKGLSATLPRGKTSIEIVRVSGPFEVLGRGRDPDGRSWGRFIRWRDPDGRVHEKFVADENLQGEPSKVCAPLAAEGLEIVRERQSLFTSYVSRALHLGRVTVVQRTGWHRINGESVFVLPSENIGRNDTGRVLLESSARTPYEAKGTLDEWRNGVGSLATDHTFPALSISVALAGPLLHPAEMEGGGFHFHGQSSRGKTTCLTAAASVWGPGDTYRRTWRATANGLEGAAAQYTDTVMVLDELGMVDPRDAAQAFYGLANGQGKQRAARDGSPREPRSWRVLLLSSGETTVDAKLSEAPGRRARAGQLVRLLDVPADRGQGCGVFDNGGPDDDPRALAEAIRLAANSACGTAGPAFVRKLLTENVTGDDVRTIISDFVVKNCPNNADAQVKRAAQRFGLIAAAGELAISFGIVPWSEGTACNAAAWAFQQWLERRGGAEPAEARQAVECVRLFIEQHGDARFAPVDETDARPVPNRAGFRKGYGADREWWILPEVWKAEICNGQDPQFVARALAERGMLRLQADKLQANVRVGNKTLRCYVVTPAIFDGASDAD